jgi:hypothetical protein
MCSRLIRSVRKFALAAAVVGVVGLPSVATAGRWDQDDDRGKRYDDRDGRKSGRIDVRVDINSSRDRFPGRDGYVTYEKRVWVEPVYRTVCDRVWIEPEYRTVCDRVWHEPVYEDRCERVWVPDRFEVRYEKYWDGCGWRKREVRVCVERGHWEERPTRVCVREGYWEDVTRRECVREGHWKNIERRELVSAGYWTTKLVREKRNAYQGDGRYASADRGDRYDD